LKKQQTLQSAFDRTDLADPRLMKKASILVDLPLEEEKSLSPSKRIQQSEILKKATKAAKVAKRR
jgi:hypothetical protein